MVIVVRYINLPVEMEEYPMFSNPFGGLGEFLGLGRRPDSFGRRSDPSESCEHDCRTCPVQDDCPIRALGLPSPIGLLSGLMEAMEQSMRHHSTMKAIGIKINPKTGDLKLVEQFRGFRAIPEGEINPELIAAMKEHAGVVVSDFKLRQEIESLNAAIEELESQFALDSAQLRADMWDAFPHHYGVSSLSIVEAAEEEAGADVPASESTAETAEASPKPRKLQLLVSPSRVPSDVDHPDTPALFERQTAVQALAQDIAEKKQDLAAKKRRLESNPELIRSKRDRIAFLLKKYHRDWFAMIEHDALHMVVDMEAGTMELQRYEETETELTDPPADMIPFIRMAIVEQRIKVSADVVKKFGLPPECDINFKPENN